MTSSIVFNKIHVVRKLDDVSNVRINRLYQLIEQAVCERPSISIVEANQCDENTLVIALGGDGTMLHAMRLASHHCAIALGVNLGNVGFLTDFTEASFSNEIKDIIVKQEAIYPVERRTILSAAVGSSSDLRFFTAINEISISATQPDVMISYRLSFGRCTPIDAGIHKANSIMVSTPTGSTAYSLSAGGALMYPTMRALQVVPVAPATLTSRPLLVDSDMNISISIQKGSVLVRADGQQVKVLENISKDQQFTINVVGDDHQCRVMHSSDWNFFTMLSNKLGWIKH